MEANSSFLLEHLENSVTLIIGKNFSDKDIGIMNSVKHFLGFIAVILNKFLNIMSA